MAKHLTRIVPVDVLPDPAGYEEGYPVLFEGRIYTIDTGAWSVAGPVSQADSLPADATGVADGTPLIVGELLYVASGEVWTLATDLGGGGEATTAAAATPVPYVPVAVERGTLVDAVDLDAPYALAVSGNYAYVNASGTSDSIAVVDVSDPTAPVIVGSTPTDSTLIGTVHHMALRGHLLYCVGGTNRLTIVDVSNPTAPTIVGNYLDDDLQSPRGLVVEGDYAYVAGAYTDRIVIVNVSNPASPTLSALGDQGSGNGPFNPGTLLLVGDYLLAPGDGVFDVFDVSDPTVTPPRVARLPHADLAAHRTDMVLVGNYALVTVAGPWDAPLVSRLVVVDVSDPTAPTYVRTVAISGNTSIGALHGDYFYIPINDDEATPSNGGFIVFDVSDPSFPAELLATTLAAPYSGVRQVVAQGSHLYASVRDTDALYVLG